MSLPKSASNAPARPPSWSIFIFGVAYLLTGGLGQKLALIPGVAIIFWPPGGILIGTLLLTPRSTWPWWLATGAAAELTCNVLWFHNSIPFALLYYAANALEALTAAWLVGRSARLPFRMQSFEEVGAFLILAAGTAPMVGATIIATIDAVIGKHPFTTAWPLVWLGDSVGMLVSAPLTMTAIQTWRERTQLQPRRILEATVLAAVLIGSGVWRFRGLCRPPT